MKLILQRTKSNYTYVSKIIYLLNYSLVSDSARRSNQKVTTSLKIKSEIVVPLQACNVPLLSKKNKLKKNAQESRRLRNPILHNHHNVLTATRLNYKTTVNIEWRLT